MATRIRDIAPLKEKKGVSSSSHTKENLNCPSKTNNTPAQIYYSTSSSHKHIPNYLRPTISSTTNLSKQSGKKPVPTHTVHKPTLNSPTRKSIIDKNPSPKPKARVSTNQSLRSSSFWGKTSGSQKPVASKDLSSLTKDAKKPNSTLVRSVKKSNTCIKKEDTGNSKSATEEQITIMSPHENVEKPSDFTVPVNETPPKDQESFIDEAEKQTVQVVSSDEKGTNTGELVSGNKKPLDVGQTEDDDQRDDDKDANIIEHQGSPLGIKTQESEDKSCHEETNDEKQHELEEHNVNEVSNTSDTEEKEVYEVKLVVEEDKQEEDTLTSKNKDDEARETEANEEKETEKKKMIEEINQESENANPKQHHQGKKESAVSNGVIEETASKLREQRKNKVKALAGAFETVISLQETK